MSPYSDRIREDVFAPAQFLTPFPHHLLGICGSARVYNYHACVASTLKCHTSYSFHSHTVLDARLRRVPSAAIRGRLNLLYVAQSIDLDSLYMKKS